MTYGVGAASADLGGAAVFGTPNPEPSTRSPETRRLIGLATLALLFGLSWVASALPQPARGIILLSSTFVVPGAAWYSFYRRRVQIGMYAAVALSLTTTLALISLAEFVLLLCRLGSGVGTSAAAVAVAAAIPLLWVTPADVESRVFSGATTRSINYLASSFLWIFPAIAALVGGGFVLEKSMNLARPYISSGTAFNVFWLGMALIFIPVFILAFVRGEQLFSWLIVIAGAGTYLPVFLRSPFKAIAYDEVGHFGETEQLLISGRLFQPDSVVLIGPKYPGLETLVAAISRLTGISVMGIGQPVVLLSHVLTLFGIAYLAMLLFGPERRRAALIAALLYAISPQFLEFDAIFSYESISVPVAIWLTICILHAVRKAESIALWRLPAGLLLAFLVITHHLAAIVLALLLFLIAVSAWLGGPLARSKFRTGRIFGAGANQSDESVLQIHAGKTLLWSAIVAVALLGWAAAVRAPLIKYLGVFPSTAYSALVRYASGTGLVPATSQDAFSGQVGGTRVVFDRSYLPIYEQKLSIVGQVLIFAWFLLAVWKLRSARPSALRWAFAVFGGLYFLSLPLIYVSGAAQGAHRSWAYSYIGLAVTLPWAFEKTSSSAARRAASTSSIWTRLAAPVMVPITLCILMVGNYAASVNVFVQFPGEYVLGADGRDGTSDMIRSAEWFSNNVGRGEKIVTNQRTLAVFGAYAHAQNTNFPAWKLFFPTTTPSLSVQAELEIAGVGYVVADERLTQYVPLQRYFAQFQPVPPSVPLPAASLDKFNSIPWLKLIHQDGNISIYQVVN